MSKNRILADQAGSIVQIKRAETNAMSTVTTVMPDDDTIPQNDEGSEILTVAITPKSATNKLHIVGTIYAGRSTGRDIVTALFRDTTSNAFAAIHTEAQTSTGGTLLHIDSYVDADTTSEIVFKIRTGPDGSATLTINGVGGSRQLGGTMVSSLTVTEIAT